MHVEINVFKNVPVNFHIPKWPDPHFHKKHQKPPGLKFWNPKIYLKKKIPEKPKKNTPKMLKMTVFNILKLLLNMFRGNTGSGHFGILQ